MVPCDILSPRNLSNNYIPPDILLALFPVDLVGPPEVDRHASIDVVHMQFRTASTTLQIVCEEIN